MVTRAIGDYPKFKASNIEFSMPQPSYTSDTLAYLQEKFPQNKFALIMGEDNLSSFHKWKNHETIIENNHLLVYPRPDCKGSKFYNHPHVHMIEAPNMEISSSFIRQAVKQDKDVRFFMAEKVWQYMDEMNFYK